jgi:hypothetical protein
MGGPQLSSENRKSANIKKILDYRTLVKGFKCSNSKVYLKNSAKPTCGSFSVILPWMGQKVGELFKKGVSYSPFRGEKFATSITKKLADVTFADLSKSICWFAIVDEQTKELWEFAIADEAKNFSDLRFEDLKKYLHVAFDTGYQFHHCVVGGSNSIGQRGIEPQLKSQVGAG